MSANKIFLTPFGLNGNQTAIPDAPQPSGEVSYDQGFTADYSRQLGVDPLAKNIDRANFNSLMNDVTSFLRDVQSGVILPYNLSLATAIGGYPLAARILRADGQGIWINTVAGNTSNPDTGGAGWRALIDAGLLNLTLSSADVTLTALQAANKVIALNGTLSTNVNVIFPAWLGAEWTIYNVLTTNGFTATIKNPSGAAVVTVNQPAAYNVTCFTAGMGLSVNGGVTQPQFSNLDLYATTAFVQRALGNFHGSLVTGASYVIVPADMGKLVISNFIANGTLTLPLSSSVPLGAAVLLNNVNQAVTLDTVVNTQGSDIIATANVAGNFTMNYGDSALVVNQGAGIWRVASGSVLARYTTVARGRLLRRTIYRLLGGVLNKTVDGSGFAPDGGNFFPHSQTRIAIVDITAGGGAGGGSQATGPTQISAGGGGGAGGWTQAIVPIAAMSGGVVVTLGVGGVGVTGAAGNNGGASSFGSIVSNNGGQGGTVATFPQGVNGIVATGGLGGSTPTPPVFPGFPGVEQYYYGGDGGGSFYLSNGATGGQGGISHWGAGGPYYPSGPKGVDAPSGGAGGGGAASDVNQAAKPGGTGGSGYLIIEEYA